MAVGAGQMDGPLLVIVGCVQRNVGFEEDGGDADCPRVSESFERDRVKRGGVGSERMEEILTAIVEGVEL